MIYRCFNALTAGAEFLPSTKMTMVYLCPGFQHGAFGIVLLPFFRDRGKIHLDMPALFLAKFYSNESKIVVLVKKARGRSSNIGWKKRCDFQKATKSV